MPRSGAEAWQGFGRRIAFGFFAFFVLGPLLIGTLLIVVATVAFDVSPWVWFGIALLPLVLALTVAIFGRFAFRTLLPVRDLIRAAGSLADGDYSVRVASSNAGVRPVVSSFNQMAERLELADEQRRQLLGDLGHELRTPLTVIRGEIEAILDGVHQADPDHLELLLDEVQVMERLLEDLRTLSLAEAGTLALHPEPTDLVDLVSDVGELHRRMADAAGVAVTVSTVASLPQIMVDPVRIREVISNLIINSLRAMPDGGALELTVGNEGSSVLITVTDTGVGMPADEVAKAFERFHKGSTSSGSGLGLTISRDLIEVHGGSIVMASKVGVGTSVSVRLPKIVAT
jgi:two-component system sensor histidine kinase BaeS